jgi:hypothetical protein
MPKTAADSGSWPLERVFDHLEAQLDVRGGA